MRPEFRMSETYKSRCEGMPFGFALIVGSSNPSDPDEFKTYKRKLLRKMRARAVLAEISRRISLYDGYFSGFGYECPLPSHLNRVIKSGFPRYNLMVDAHFMAEMCAGILVAVGDFNMMEEPLTLDVADEGERFEAMGSRVLTTREGEVVLRDAKGIICALCQGADERTRIREDTSNILFYSYGVPGIEAVHIRHGLTIAAETVIRFGGGRMESLEVFS
jgi:DNA/RNA-binding domain of Phe-tRNA-synthetase-like protein